ncbi:MAG: hypothetical protein ABSC89_14805 [Verrucomicrobiota bacterium]
MPGVAWPFIACPTRSRQFTADLAAAKENLAKLCARWEELEKIKAAAERV